MQAAAELHSVVDLWSGESFAGSDRGCRLEQHLLVVAGVAGEVCGSMRERGEHDAKQQLCDQSDL